MACHECPKKSFHGDKKNRNIKHLNSNILATLVVNLPSPQPASHPSTPLLQIPEDPTTPVLAMDTSPPTTPVLQLTDEEDG